jgi:hypothetical protein
MPLCFQQDASHQLRQLRQRRPNVAVWWGMMVEVARLEAQRSSWLEVAPSDKVRNLAAEIPEQYGLRALDSFQLAAALVWCRERPRGRLFVCCDTVLVNAALEAGFEIYP